jgi:DNA-directed RNA polymerase specialized sigma24 family protein
MRVREARVSFEDFVHARSGSLLRTALLLTGQNRPEAEDLLQLALERAYRHWPRICGSDDPERYVRRILANASADRWRRLTRRPEQSLPGGDAGPMTDIEDRLRAAMHVAVDSEEAPHDLINLVMRRHRRRAALVAGVTMLIAIGAGGVPAALALRGHGDQSAARPASSAAPASGSRPPSHPAHPATPKPQHRAPSKLRGLPMPAGNSLQLLLTGPRPALFSMATRAAEPIAGLPVTKAAYVFTRVVGGWSARPYLSGSGCAPDCAGPPLPNYFIADGSLTATPIDPGFAVSASGRGGAVWLVTFGRSTDHIETAPASAQLVSTAGTPIGPKYRLPAGYLIERAVGRYLLLTAMSQPRLDPGLRQLPSTPAECGDREVRDDPGAPGHLGVQRHFQLRWPAPRRAAQRGHHA